MLELSVLPPIFDGELGCMAPCGQQPTILVHPSTSSSTPSVRSYGIETCDAEAKHQLLTPLLAPAVMKPRDWFYGLVTW
jgi:hypothetical protein